MAQTGPQWVAATQELDGKELDGHLDYVEIRDFANAMDTTFVDLGKIRVSGYDLVDAQWQGPTTLHVFLRPKLVHDTGATPTVSLSAGAVKSADGDPLASGSKVALDEAQPVLLAVYAELDSKNLLAWFSEGVVGSGTDGIVVPNDFGYNDNSGDQNFIAGAPANKDHTAGQRFVWLETDKDLTEAMVKSSMDEIPTTWDTLSITGAVQDQAASPNDAVIRHGDPDVAVAEPHIIQADGDIGKPFVQVRFNGPIDSVGTDDLDILRADEGGASGIVAVESANRGDVVIVTLDKPLTPSDVDSSPLKVKVPDGKVRGSTINVFAPEKEAPLIDVTTPKLQSASTRDTDRDGFIDALHLTFSEPVSNDVDFDQVSLWDLRGDTAVELGHGVLSFSLSTLDSQNDASVRLEFDQAELDMKTGELPAIVMGIGAFRDLANSPNVGTNVQPNLSSEVVRGSVTVADGAPPIIESAVTRDRDGNGFLDGYELTFSEAVDDSSFTPSDWTILDYAVKAVGEADDDDEPDDHVLFVEVTQRVDPALGDTGATPQILYRTSSTGSGLTDLRGNRMVAFGEGAVVEQDGARPHLLYAFAEIGSDIVHLEFSEGVEAANGGGLTLQDILFLNGNGDEGASGRLSLQHTAGDRNAFLRLNAPVTAADLSSDRVKPAASDNIVEVGGSRTVPPNEVELRTAVDRVPPARIHDLRVVSGSISANSVGLQWTAPGDDDITGDPVSGYIIKVDTLDITGDRDFQLAPEADTVAYDPEDLVGPDEQQKAVVAGLLPGTEYFVSVKAFDDGDLAADEPSPSVSFTTLADITPPEGACASINASVVNTVTAGRNVLFQWEPWDDPDSTVLYRYGVGTAASATLAADSPSATSNETVVLVPWTNGPSYFYLQAESGGGADDPCVLQVPAYPDDDAYYESHNGTLLRAVLDRGSYEITWTLPLEEDLPGPVRGVSIWRLAPGAEVPELIITLNGDYDFLAQGRYVDVSQGTEKGAKYALTMEFTQRPGFPSLQDPPDMDRLTLASVEQLPVVPWWAWLLIGVLAVLLIAGLVAFFVLRRQGEEGWDPSEEIDESEFEGDPFAEDGWTEVSDDTPVPAATAAAAASGPESQGGPVHDVTCPRCSTRFQAHGERPVRIECPSCGVKGTL